MQQRQYAFSWDLLGDIDLGRPNLGPLSRLETYRLMQFSLRDALEQRYGTAEADEIFREAGRIAGRAFYDHIIAPVTDLHQFVLHLQNAFRDLRIGVLRMEETDLERGRFVMTLDEDLDCSGLPEIKIDICKYDEGFIAGLFGAFTGKEYRVTEVDCWCTGDRTCRFVAEVVFDGEAAAGHTGR